MPYAVEITDAAARVVGSIGKKQQRQVAARIDGLAENPRPRGCQKLQGGDDLHRVGSGDYRIIYQVADERLRVLVIRIGHRREVYR